MYRLIHCSDLHAGPPFHEATANRLVEQMAALRPDLVVVSGDFVQRADFPNQWRTIKALLARLPQPQLLVAGNHDVPLFNVARRTLTPLNTYRRQIHPNLNPLFTRPGLVVAGACTAHGLTLDGGVLSRQQRAMLRANLANQPLDAWRVVTWHHPVITPPQANRPNRQMLDAVGAARLLDELQVDLLLTGHLHFHYVANTRDLVSGLQHGTTLCQSGTTTSRRGHANEKGQSSFNLIELGAAAMTITPFVAELGQPFMPQTAQIITRRGAAVQPTR